MWFNQLFDRGSEMVVDEYLFKYWNQLEVFLISIAKTDNEFKKLLNEKRFDCYSGYGYGD